MNVFAHELFFAQSRHYVVIPLPVRTYALPDLTEP